MVGISLVVALQHNLCEVVGIVEMGITACLHQIRPHHYIVVARQYIKRHFVVVTFGNILCEYELLYIVLYRALFLRYGIGTDDVAYLTIILMVVVCITQTLLDDRCSIVQMFPLGHIRFIIEA